MKKIFRYSLLLLCYLRAAAQTDTTGHLQDSARPEVAIFTPLYLDSAYDANGDYRYDKSFPRYINPGLEFYEGAQMALDTMAKEKATLVVRVYDTRSTRQTLQQMLDDSAFQRVGLIIGQVNSPQEMQVLAGAAARKNIPFVDVNYPNDAGITNNPNLVILNSTLRTHCEGIYRYLQRNYPTKPLVFFRRNGSQEDRLKGYFTDLDKHTASVPLKIKYVTLDDNFDAAALAANLDSMSQTVCIAGSLDEAFGSRLCGMLASMKSYRTLLMGMPTWDQMDLTKPEYGGEAIVYTTPFYLNPADTLVKLIQQNFKTRFYSRPSDMVYRGYESVYRFCHLLLQHPAGLSGSIGEKRFKVFDDFEILPVFLNRQTMTLDYLENKKLYFIKMMDGTVVSVN
jgi:hypothetical protein